MKERRDDDKKRSIQSDQKPTSVPPDPNTVEQLREMTKQAQEELLKSSPREKKQETLLAPPGKRVFYQNTELIEYKKSVPACSKQEEEARERIKKKLLEKAAKASTVRVNGETITVVKGSAKVWKRLSFKHTYTSFPLKQFKIDLKTDEITLKYDVDYPSADLKDFIVNHISRELNLHSYGVQPHVLRIQEGSWEVVLHAVINAITPALSKLFDGLVPVLHGLSFPMGLAMGGIALGLIFITVACFYPDLAPLGFTGMVMTGAGTGFLVGGPPGAAIGATVGAASGLFFFVFNKFIEKKINEENN